METAVRLESRTPQECDEKGLGDFMTLVLAGGEVSPQGLEARIGKAHRLFFLSSGDCLSGIAALKEPSDGYRKSLEQKAGLALKKEQYPFELGWVFVMPSARGRKYSTDLVRAAVEVSEGKGIFATSRTENQAMHASLRNCGFSAVGNSYPSGRGKYEIQVFTRPSAATAVDIANEGITKATQDTDA